MFHAVTDEYPTPRTVTISAIGALNGLILISSALNFQTIGQDRDAMMFRPGNDLPYMVFLPTYAATAWFHGRLAKKHQARQLRQLMRSV